MTESRKKGWSSEDQGKDPPVNIQKAMDRSEILCFHGELSIAIYGRVPVMTPRTGL